MTDPIRNHLREPHDERRAHSNWEEIERRRARASLRPSARRWPTFAVAGGTLAAAAVLAVFLTRPAAPTRGLVASGAELDGQVRAGVTALDDGSRVTVDPSAHLDVLENGPTDVRFWLREGEARFDIVPNGPRRWVVETGWVTVEVLGTAFRVVHGTNEVQVEVERGIVLVRGAGVPTGMRRLTAGERIAVPVERAPSIGSAARPDLGPSAAASIPSASPTSDVITAAATVIPAPTEAVSAEAAVPSEPTAREATPARTRRTARVVAAAAPSTPEAAPEAPAAVAPPAASGPSLREVDALRASGHLDEAVRMLEAISRDATRGEERAIAALTLGRIELDRRRRPDSAVAALQLALRLGLREPLRDDAEARLIEALSRTAEPTRARAAALRYLADRPAGRWRREVERWGGVQP